MMNRSMQRELIKLLLQVNGMWQTVTLGDRQQQNMVLDIFKTVEDRCRHEFSADKAEQYVDILQTLIRVIQDTSWKDLSETEKQQSLVLLQDIVLGVTNKLRQEKEIKKEIVFLPYKASMWDSLESIWQAAQADRDSCNTYVIPLPYCDLNEDRSIARWHWDISEFPEYVPVLEYREYTLEKLQEMRPDVIFIHNPYDDCNRITSIDEHYYSRNLKKCTDLLIYIPYFVTKWKVDVGKCNVPGVVNADYVMLQDELICNWYKEVYAHPEEKHKFLIMGSPKVDKIRSIKKSQYPLPREWENLIGTKKHILFFNINFHGCLKNPQEFFKHLAILFEVIENSKDILLWWRPHPLLENGLESMFPELLDEYRRLKDIFIKQKIGIYDELTDFYPGFAWSDAYYGDQSSLHTLYQCMNKPTSLIPYEKIHNPHDCMLMLNQLIEHIGRKEFKWKRNINDTVPHHAGLNIYNWLKNK